MATPEPCLIYDDPRTIKIVRTEGSAFCVGEWDLDRIVAYREHGQADFVPWLAFYYVGGDQPTMRMPAADCTIIYGDA